MKPKNERKMGFALGGFQQLDKVLKVLVDITVDIVAWIELIRVVGDTPKSLVEGEAFFSGLPFNLKKHGEYMWASGGWHYEPRTWHPGR